MNAINHPAALSAGAAAEPADMCSNRPLKADSLPDEMHQHTLRRTGHKPVRFNGRQILEIAGSTDRDCIWHDLNLYRSAADAVIVELVVRRVAVSEPDIFRVEVFVNMDDAVCWLESYQSAKDIPVPASLFGTDVPLSTAIIHTVCLRRNVLHVEDEFHGLVSDALMALGIADDIDGRFTKTMGNKTVQ